MAPESFAAAEMVKLTGVVPSVNRTMAFVVQPLGAVLACTCTRVTVMALSGVQVEPVQVVVSAPGRKMFCSPRGLAVSDSLAIFNLYVVTPLLDRFAAPAPASNGGVLQVKPETSETTWPGVVISGVEQLVI